MADWGTKGPAFRFERDMVESARRWLVDLGVITKAEFATPWGICDLVGVSFNEEHVQQRLNLGQRECIGPPLRIEILRRIPDSATGRLITFRRLERECAGALTAHDLAREVRRLVARKFVRVGNNGLLQKIDGWVPLHDRIIAVELKLLRVADVLSQAASHLRFASESYAGLPAQLALRIAGGQRSEDFRRAGVGILAVSGRDCCVVLPAHRQPSTADPVMQMHCVERFWRSRVTGN